MCTGLIKLLPYQDDVEAVRNLIHLLGQEKLRLGIRFNPFFSSKKNKLNWIGFLQCVKAWLNSKDTHKAYYHYNFSSFNSGGGLWLAKSDCFFGGTLHGRKDPCWISVDTCPAHFSWGRHLGTFLWRWEELDRYFWVTVQAYHFSVPSLTCMGFSGDNTDFQERKKKYKKK